MNRVVDDCQLTCKCVTYQLPHCTRLWGVSLQCVPADIKKGGACGIISRASTHVTMLPLVFKEIHVYQFQGSQQPW